MRISRSVWVKTIAEVLGAFVVRQRVAPARQHVDESTDPRQRGPQLVARDRDEVGLHRIELRQPFDDRGLLGAQARRLERHAELVGDRLQRVDAGGVRDRRREPLVERADDRAAHAHRRDDVAIRDDGGPPGRGRGDRTRHRGELITEQVAGIAVDPGHGEQVLAGGSRWHA